MRILSIDLETRSSRELARCGVYSYCESEDFEILLFAYAFDEDEVKIADLSCGGRIPEDVMEALVDPGVIKTAWNANFERTCLARYLKIPMPPEQWRCTMVHALSLGLPGSLEEAAGIMKLPQQKMKEGKALIRYFTLPSNGGRGKKQPGDDPEKWERFKEYCKRDVEVERAIRRKLDRYPMLSTEQGLWELDQRINDEGILIDRELVRNAIKIHRDFQEKIFDEAAELSGICNPNSLPQIKEWLKGKGIERESLLRKNVQRLALDAKDPEIRGLMAMRLDISKTSIKKYEAMERSVCRDGRIRGLFQFYGANRTGRWAGRIVQVQNLPQNHLKDLDLARELVRMGDFTAVELMFDSLPQVLSELIRTAFVPGPGGEFICCDYNSVEARVLSWLAGEEWRLNVFKTHGKIYEAIAGQMFKVPMEEVTKDSPLRQKGKIAELALGYGGSVGALKAMGALDMGITEDELFGLVNAWRRANPNIARFWWDIDRAALSAVKDRKPQQVGRIKIGFDKGILFITLPSGRKLSYISPRIEKSAMGRDMLTFEGVDANKRWGRVETYGPKLVENIVQAASRDLLGEGMKRIAERGCRIVMHVHDEIVVEVEKGMGSLEELQSLMSQVPDWAEGLPLKADGFVCEYYRK